MHLFIENFDVANYTHEATPDVLANDYVKNSKTLQKISDYLLAWFEINRLKANPEKGHVLLRTKEKQITKIGHFSILIKSCYMYSLFYNDLYLDKYFHHICQKLIIYVSYPKA